MCPFHCPDLICPFHYLIWMGDMRLELCRARFWAWTEPGLSSAAGKECISPCRAGHLPSLIFWELEPRMLVLFRWQGAHRSLSIRGVAKSRGPYHYAFSINSLKWGLLFSPKVREIGLAWFSWLGAPSGGSRTGISNSLMPKHAICYPAYRDHLLQSRAAWAR